MGSFREENFLTNSKIFLFTLLSFVAGIGLASFFPVSWLEKDVWWFAGAIACGLGFLTTWNLGVRSRKIIGSGFLFLAVFFFAIWRYAISMPKSYVDEIQYYNGKTVTVIGRVYDEPDKRENNTKLKIATEYISGESIEQTAAGKDKSSGKAGGEVESSLAFVENFYPVHGLMLVTVNSYPEYGYGDRVEIVCHLKKPDIINDFAYDRYLARYDIYSVCYYPKTKLLTKTEFKLFSFPWLYNGLLQIRKFIQQSVGQGMGEPESSLAAAITFGIRQNIPSEISTAFSQTGLTHIMAVSGMNISIIAAVTANVLLALGFNRKKTFYLTTALIIIFVLLVAAPASAIRAGIMGFIILWALSLGRLNKMTNSILLAAAIMLMFNPKILRDDLGFQLSFLATLSLVYFYPIIKTWSEKSSRTKKIPKIIKETLLVTLAAQVLTLPILIFNFHFMSLIAPIANLFALWTITPIMFFTFFGIIISLVSKFMALLIFFPAWLMTKYLLMVTQTLANLPYSYVTIGYLDGLIMIGYYLILAIFLFRRENRMKSIDFS